MLGGLRSVCALAVALAAVSCAPRINFGLSSVPEEGGVRFTRITSDEEGVVAPNVVADREYGLRYYTQRPFDVAPDGQSIAYLARKNNQQNIFVRSTQGGAATTQRTFRESIADVAYSPDGQRVAFSDFRNQRWNVYEINARSGSAIRQLTNSEQISRFPEYLPVGDSNTVLYVQYESSVVSSTNQVPVALTRYYVWGYDMDRGAHTQYSEGYAPSASPDGKRIAVTRNSRDHGNSEIWIIDLASGEEILVASSRRQGYMQPSFSPNGRTLVFTGVTMKERARPTNLDVFTVDVDGGNLTQLTFHPGHDLMPRFGPDGNTVYFLSQRGNDKGRYNIWRLERR
jgi:Tol biopolymer transport system component